MGNRKLFINVNATLEIIKKANGHLKFKQQGSGGSYVLDKGVVVFKSEDSPYAVIIRALDLALLSSSAVHITRVNFSRPACRGEKTRSVLKYFEDGTWYIIDGGHKTCLGMEKAGGVYYQTFYSLSYFADNGVLCYMLYPQVFKNDADFGFLICKSWGEAYSVWKIEDHCLVRAKADLMMVKRGKEEFVLDFIPEKECFRRIDLFRPSLAARAEKLFDSRCFFYRVPDVRRIFFAPRSLGEWMYDAWEAAGMLWDRFYIWLRTGSDIKANEGY